MVGRWFSPDPEADLRDTEKKPALHSSINGTAKTEVVQ